MIVMTVLPVIDSSYQDNVDVKQSTVEPLLSGHPRGNGKWPLNRVSQKLA